MSSLLKEMGGNQTNQVYTKQIKLSYLYFILLLGFDPLISEIYPARGNFIIYIYF